VRLAVLLPAQNAEGVLAEAVESVLQQTYRDFELILIDDGSTDGTRTIMESFARRDGRVRVMAHPHLGMGASLNRAIAAIESTWVARMDADDVMMPTRLERQLAFLDAHPDVAVASCLLYYINAGGRVLARSTSDLLTVQDFDSYVRSNRLIAVPHPGAIMNREVVLAVGGYRPRFWPADDLDLWNRIAEAGHRILVQPEYLLKYRIHGASVCVSQPVKTDRQIRWVERCMLARRSGLPEPSLDEFLAMERSAPWVERLHRQRRTLAHCLYKSATHHYGARQYGRLIGALMASMVLDPWFGWSRFRGRPRVRREPSMERPDPAAAGVPGSGAGGASRTDR
jgi:glycosyltransferase involved in cell wall biosynthesis